MTLPTPKGCSKCKVAPAANGQRWCTGCRADWKRQARRAARSVAEAPPGREQNLAGEHRGTPPGDGQPQPSVADGWDGWRGAYLRHLVATGQRVRGCAIAGISRRELQAELEADPEFREAVDTAMG